MVNLSKPVRTALFLFLGLVISIPYMAVVMPFLKFSRLAIIGGIFVLLILDYAVYRLVLRALN